MCILLLHSRTILLAADNLIPNFNLPLNNQLRYCEANNKIADFCRCENVSGKKLAVTILIDGMLVTNTCVVNNDFNFTCKYREF